MPACTDNLTNSPGIYDYKVPEQTSDGWQTVSLSSVGMNDNYITALMDDLESAQDHNIHSLLIVKDGKLVFEEYFPGEKFNLAQYTGRTGFDIDTHTIYVQQQKSFTSALIGIAIDKHFIKSVNY